MWKKISAAISILCTVVYVFAVVLAVSKMVSAAAEHRIIFEQEFAKLQDMVRGADVLGFTGADIENEIRASVLRSLTLDAAIVTPSGGAAFAVEKPGERVIVPHYNNTGYSFDTKWKWYRPPYTAQITAAGRTTLEINALTGYIDKERLGDILRETLLVVLLSVMAAFLVLMLDVIIFTKNTEHEEKRPPRESRKSVVDEEVEELREISAEEPMGIYLGLIQKLQKELTVADEKKTDIVLLCVEWTKNGFANTNTPLAKQIAEEAAAFFRSDRISAFKRGETGIFIVLPDVAFKRGLKAAREFHGRILDNTAFKTTITSVYVGLTSRAGREIDPKRLILEAEKAVEKAKEDAAQPIVAFKADPSKYKNYLKNKSFS
ncbi:MAG: hypothetical protein LBT00_14325 [Spirochaetaceae bacterium]|jgi:hypothetical protein|nr:hypothetical protein [Spirochaetaceae bacterium]